MKEPCGASNTLRYPPAISPVLAGSCLFLLVLLFYVYTLAPTVIWGDSAKFATEAFKMKLAFGADAHPLYIILGHLFSFLPFEVAYSLNLLTAVTASLAVVCVYFIVFEITGAIYAAVAGAASLCLSHAFWLHAVTAEVYDLNAFFVTIIILVLLKWRKAPEDRFLLYLAALLFGLGLSNHLIMGLTVFGFLFFVISIDFRVFVRIKSLSAIICSFLVGASILLFVFLNKLQAGHAPSALLGNAAGAEHKKAMLVMSVDIFRDLFMYLAYLFYQYPLIGFLLGFGGILSLIKKDWATAVLLLLLIMVNMVFFLSFGPGVQKTTKYTFYISDYAIFSIFIGCGFKAFGHYLQKRGHSLKKISSSAFILVILSPILLYSITPFLSKKLTIDLLHARTVPYRDNETFFLNPNKRGYTGAARYAEEALTIASSNSIIIADYSIYTVLKYYQQVKDVREDLLILSPYSHGSWDIPEKTLSSHYGKRDIYLADMEKGYYKIKNLRDKFNFVPEGVLFRVVSKTGG